MLTFIAVVLSSIRITASAEQNIGPAQDQTIRVPLTLGVGVDKMMFFADLDIDMSSFETTSLSSRLINTSTELYQSFQAYLFGSTPTKKKQKLKLLTSSSDDSLYPYLKISLTVQGQSNPVVLKVDSGEDWMMMPTLDCQTCDQYAGEKCDKIFDSYDSKHSCGDGYDPSERFSTLQHEGIQRKMGSKSLIGKVWTTAFCASKTCVVDFPFFSFHQEKILTQFSSSSSVLGFSQKNTKLDTGPLFTDYLYQQLTISRSAFTVAMSGDLSYIEFGNPSTNNLKSDASFVIFQANEDFFWSFYLQAVDFAPGLVLDLGFEQISYDFEIPDRTYTIFDTGTANLMIPPKYYSQFIKVLFHVAQLNSGGTAIPYKVVNGRIQFKCSFIKFLLPIRFLIQYSWVVVDPSDYIYSMSSSSDTCVLAVLKNELEFFILGLPVFQGYSVTHDLKTSKLLFIPTQGSSKTTLQSGKIPNQKLKAEEPAKGKDEKPAKEKAEESPYDEAEESTNGSISLMKIFLYCFQIAGFYVCYKFNTIILKKFGITESLEGNCCGKFLTVFFFSIFVTFVCNLIPIIAVLYWVCLIVYFLTNGCSGNEDQETQVLVLKLEGKSTELIVHD